MYQAKKIGIFISHIFGEFQRSLCQGIIDKATEFGYIVEIFSGSLTLKYQKNCCKP